MAEPWIRVHAQLLQKPVVGRAAAALGVSRHEAVGLLVTFWGAVSQLANNGRVGDYDDSQLEAFAFWTRKRGKFAAFIRIHHLDADGRVNEWDDYAGALEQRRATERNRLRNKRQNVGQQLRNADELLQPARAVRNETIRNENNSSSSADAIWFPGREADLAARLANDHDRTALAAILHTAPNRTATAAECHAMLDGMHGAALSPEMLGDALRDYVGTGAHRTPNFKHFRGYLRNAQVAGPARVRPAPELVESELARWARETDAKEQAHA